jgi:hypothetical protein
LTADLAAGVSDPDNTHTLSVDMSISSAELPTGISHVDADAGTTGSLIDDEVLAWGHVVPTGTETYDLTYLRRGMFGSLNEAHLTGAIFSRIDPTIVLKYNLPKEYVGKKIYVKLTSFNTFGVETQDISDVVAYTYTPIGNAYSIAPPTNPLLTSQRIVQTDGTTLIQMILAWTASAGPSLGNYEVQVSTNAGTSWIAGDVLLGPGATGYSLVPALPNTNYQMRVRATSYSGLAVSAWATSAVVGSGSLTPNTPGVPTGFTATGGVNLVQLAWANNPTGDAVVSYKLYRAAGLFQPFTSATLQATLGSGNQSHTDTGLANGSQWTYYLSATNSAGEGGHTGATVATVLSYTQKFAPYFSLHVRKPLTNELLFSLPVDYPLQFPIDFAGSRGDVDNVSPTAPVTLNVLKNGTVVGTISYAANAFGRNVATFSTSGQVLSYATGDELAVQHPVTVDQTFQGFNFSLEGAR